MRQIELHGELAEKFGATHHYDVKNASEAIRALCANHKGFQKHLIESKFHYGVVLGPHVAASEDELFYPVGKSEVIHFVPVVVGAKNALTKIFLGAVLIAVAFASGGLGAGGAAGFFAGASASVGVGLVLQGVSQLLAPKDKKKDEKNDQSFGPTNITRQGVPVPVGYGRMIIGTITVGQRLTVEDATDNDYTTYWQEKDDFTREKVHTLKATNLDSKSRLNTLEILCEGEIEGVVTPYESVYLNETRVKRPNSTKYNFPEFSYRYNRGTNDQSYFKYGTYPSTTVPVGTELLKDVENIYTINDSSVDEVELVFGTPAFFKTEDDGDVVGTTAAVKIYVQNNGGGYTLVGTEAFKGKTLTHYQKLRKIKLNGSAPWDIKIVRDTGNSTPTNSRSIYLESYNVISSEKFNYPNTAMVHTSIPTEYFGSFPSRYFDVKMRKIQIPSNATVRSDGSLTYSGSWDGTFQTAWSANPAWVFYDMLLNTRFGCGDFIDSDKVDKWALYTIGQYCDELVPDGFGSTEPRFVCNVLITERKDAYSLLNSLASIFRGMTYWSAGQVLAVQDSPAEPVYLFNNANVEDGIFSYEGSSLNARHSVAVVAWRDPSNFYKQKIEVIEDREAISLFGVRQVEIDAVGCTSRGQARRFGKWAMYAEQYETDVVTFKTGLEGAPIRPFDIIKVADAMRAGARFGGRVVSATTTAITVDDTTISPTVISGSKLSVVLSDGTIEQRNVLSYSAGVFTVDIAFSSAPSAQAMWVLEPTNVDAQLFRVLSVKEDSQGFYKISALTHNPSKHDYIDTNNNLDVLDFTLLNEDPDDPENLTISESLYAQGSKVFSKVVFSFSPVAGAVKYKIAYQGNEDSIVYLSDIVSTTVEILNLKEGPHTFFVTAENGLGRKSATVSIDYTVAGKLTPPSDVQNFSLVPVERMAFLTWDVATDLDVLIGGFVRIRYTPLTSLQSWTDAVDVGPLLNGNTTQYALPLLTGTYLAKFIDSSGNASETAAQIVTTIPDEGLKNIVVTETEHPDFLGTHSGTQPYAPLNALTLATTDFIDDVTDVDALSSFDWFGSVQTSGEYTFENTVDLNDVFSSRVTASVETIGFNIGNKIDDIVELMDDWSTFDGSDFDDVNAVLYMRTTEDDPSGSPTWTEWKPFLIADYVARGFQFKVKLTSGDATHNIAVTGLSVEIDMPDRIENFYDITSGAGSYNLVYANPFKAVPVVGITAKDMTTGDYFIITGESESGCTIHFKNAGGTSVSRKFNAIVRGYGKQG